MGADEVRVDPPVLQAAARTCADLSDKVQQGNRDIEAETETAMSGLPGFQTRTALETLMFAWTDDVKGLTAYLTALSESLHGCARDYTHTDHANADLFAIVRR